MLSRYAPLEHPLAHQFQRAIESLTAALAPDSARQYRGAARHFLIYLGEDHPAVRSLNQLRRDPHILGWFAHLRSHTPPLASAVYVCRLLFLRSILQEFAWTAQLPDLAHLIRREDIPRIPQRLPRPLTAEQDRLIQQELLRRNDLPANVFLLLRHTGMRIGECADLPYDCLHNVGPDRWAIHVPLGKLKTERMVPVDSFVCELVQRLRFFRSFDPLPDGRLLARHSGKQTLMKRLRPYLSDVAAAVGISTRIVPHQLRHYAASRTMPHASGRKSSKPRLNGGPTPVRAAEMRHSLAASEILEEGQQLVVGLKPMCFGCDRRDFRQRLFLKSEVGIQIDLGRFDRLVAEPERDHRTIHTRLQQLHSRGVPEYVRRHPLVPQ